jgi:hypothetical protein
MGVPLLPLPLNKEDKNQSRLFQFSQDYDRVLPWNYEDPFVNPI